MVHAELWRVACVHGTERDATSVTLAPARLLKRNEHLVHFPADDNVVVGRLRRDLPPLFGKRSWLNSIALV